MFAAADPYNNIDKKPPGASKRLVPILEGRAAEPQQQTLRRQPNVQAQLCDVLLDGQPVGPSTSGPLSPPPEGVVRFRA